MKQVNTDQRDNYLPLLNKNNLLLNSFNLSYSAIYDVINNPSISNLEKPIKIE